MQAAATYMQCRPCWRHARQTSVDTVLSATPLKCHDFRVYGCAVQDEGPSSGVSSGAETPEAGSGAEDGASAGSRCVDSRRCQLGS